MPFSGERTLDEDGRTELYCDRVTVAGIYLGDELMLGTDPGMVPVRA